MPANGLTASYSGVEADEKPETQRIALIIQYQGTRFHGWQRQLNQRTVQAEIEQVLEAVLSKPTTLHGSGRTDSGVHAAAQVAHFDATTLIPAHRWAAVLNSRLPDDILIRASVSVTKSWHARFSACSRRYRYTIYTDARPNLFVRPYSWHYYLAPLDAEAMQAALKPLSGRQHLAAFHRAGSSRPHSWVEMQAAECERQGAFIRIEFQASGFLNVMVRLIVGMLVEVGRGIRSPGQFTELWQQQRRDLVKYAAPPQGLCLLRVGYPDFPVSPEVWFDSQPKLVLPADPVFCLI